MSSVEIIDTKFLDYDIRSCIIDNTEMFLVSDLIRQYNKINNTNKQLRDYLRNNDTKELLNAMNEENNVGEYIHQRSECSEIDKNKEEILDRENSHDLNFNNKNDKIDIPHVIKHITLQIHGGANKGYVVCEEFLIQCLMWVDKTFAIKVSKFLKNLRSINNDRFTEILKSNNDKDNQISLLQDQIKEYEQQINQLKSRYTPETYNWHFCVTHNELTNIITTVITKDQYKPVDKNVKRVYDLICCNPLVLEQQLIDILVDDQRFTQISNKEFITSITSKNIFWFFKNKCKKLRNMLEWKTGLSK